MAKQDKNALAVVKTSGTHNPEALPSGMYWAPTSTSTSKPKRESTRSRSRAVVLKRYGDAKRELARTLSELALGTRPLVTAPKRKTRSQRPAASQKKAA